MSRKFDSIRQAGEASYRVHCKMAVWRMIYFGPDALRDFVKALIMLLGCALYVVLFLAWPVSIPILAAFRRRAAQKELRDFEARDKKRTCK